MCISNVAESLDSELYISYDTDFSFGCLQSESFLLFLIERVTFWILILFGFVF